MQRLLPLSLLAAIVGPLQTGVEPQETTLVEDCVIGEGGHRHRRRMRTHSQGFPGGRRGSSHRRHSGGRSHRREHGEWHGDGGHRRRRTSHRRSSMTRRRYRMRAGGGSDEEEEYEEVEVLDDQAVDNLITFFSVVLGIGGVSLALYAVYTATSVGKSKDPTNEDTVSRSRTALNEARSRDMTWEQDVDYRGECKDYDETDEHRLQRARKATTQFSSIAPTTFKRLVKPIMFGALYFAMTYAGSIYQVIRETLETDMFEEEEVEEKEEVVDEVELEYGDCAFEHRRMLLLQGIDLPQEEQSMYSIELEEEVEHVQTRRRLPKIRIGEGPTARMIVDWLPSGAEMLAVKMHPAPDRGKMKLDESQTKELKHALERTKNLLESRNEIFDQICHEEMLMECSNGEGDWECVAGQPGFGRDPVKKKVKFPMAQGLHLLPVAAELLDRIL